MKTIYIMLVITIAVMGLALSNFINLYILNGARRSREIGIRKVNGARRKELIRQFYLETTLVVTMAFLGGSCPGHLTASPFANIMQRDSFSEVSRYPGPLSGSVRNIPAMYLSFRTLPCLAAEQS